MSDGDTSAATPITIVIADDHAPTRALVRESLEGQGFTVVADVATGDEAVEAAERHHPHVALLDVHMPGDGIAAARRIANRAPETSVVMFTVSRADASLFDALTAGAVGYLLKDTDPDRLGEALRGVLAGEAALPKALVTRVIAEFRSRSSRRMLPKIGGRDVQLTEKEWETLDGMREGLTTKEIADRMGVSPVTVRTHVRAIVRKLKVSDRSEALRLLEEN